MLQHSHLHLCLMRREMGYLGSKAASGAYQAIISAMPPHDVYIETHIGSGAIFKRKPLAPRSIGIDIDPDAINRLRDIAGIELHQDDAIHFLRNFNFSSAGRVLLYADPPYLMSTRSSNNRYNYEYTDDDHRQLISVLRDLSIIGVSVMLSGYPSTLYDELLPDWKTFQFQVMSRGGVRTEKVWMNFTPDYAYWATHAGDNFTDRQRIKRKAERWAKNYKALPAGERLAVLAAILEIETI